MIRRDLNQPWLSGILSDPLSRRQLLKRTILLGASIPVGSGLLIACTQDEQPGEDSETTDDDSDAEADDEDTDDMADDDAGSDDTETEDDAEDSDDDSSADTGDDVLVVGWDQDILDLDPVHMGDALATEVSTKIYSRLVRWETGDFSVYHGDLAEEWEMTDDGLEWTFHLREGVQWHDDYGELTAEDVRYSFLRHQDEELAGRFMSEAEPIEDVVADDDYTVRILMTAPYPDFFPQFAAYRPGFIVNQQAIEELGDQYTESPIGSGPFTFDNWSPEDRVELARNPDYYGDAGQFSGIRYVIIREPATKEVALERGEIDVCYFFEPEILQRINEHPDLNVDSFPGPRTFYIRVNLEVEPLDDVRVRQALWYGIDKELLVEEVLEGFGQPTDTLFNTHVFGRLDESPYSYDPDRAMELLEEAGHGDGIDGLTLATYPPYDQAAQVTAIQAMWSEIGVNVELDIVEFALLSERRVEGAYDLDYGPTLRLGSDQYASLMHSGNIPTTNVARYENPEMDELIDQARVEPNDDQRRELYHEVQRISQEDAPYIPILNPDFVLAFSSSLEGAKADFLMINALEITRA